MNKIKNNNLVVRALSGAVLLVIVVGAILLSKYTFAALIALIGIGCLVEFYRIANAAGAEVQRCFGIFLGVVAIVLNFLAASGTIMIKYLIVLFPLAALAFIIELYRKRGNPLVNISSTLTGVVYTALPVSLLFYIAIEPIGLITTYSPYLILSYIFIVWANDIGAYLVGVAIGRHRLFERISPKKSWEGFFGGMITAVAAGVLFGWLLDDSLLFWGGLSLVVVVSGVFGDLVESMFKRSTHIKDSGAIMPGHGGFLDRFDALILSAPFVFVYFTIFTF